MAVDSSAGVFPVVGQGPQLLGDAVAEAAGGAQVVVRGPGPGQGRRWLPLGCAPSLEGVVLAGADRDVNDPGGCCGNYSRGGKARQAAKAELGQNTWNEVLVFGGPSALFYQGKVGGRGMDLPQP